MRLLERGRAVDGAANAKEIREVLWALAKQVSSLSDRPMAVAEQPGEHRIGNCRTRGGICTRHEEDQRGNEHHGGLTEFHTRCLGMPRQHHGEVRPERKVRGVRGAFGLFWSRPPALKETCCRTDEWWHMI